MQNLVSLVFLVALVAMVMGLIKPAWVLFYLQSKHQTRPKAFGLYASIFILCVLLSAAVSEPDETEVYLAQLATEAEQAEKDYASQSKSKAVEATASQKQILENRETIQKLYAQLMQFRNNTDFHRMGFGAGLPYTHKWLEAVEKVDNAMSLKRGYPLLLASSAGYLRQLGMEYMHSQGKENEATQIFRQYIEEGLRQ